MPNDYLIDRDLRDARRRLQLLEALDDPGTVLQLEAIGVDRGWTCLEVGAGGGSVTAWLCTRVGDEGRVVAVDLDSRFLADLNFAALEIREGDLLEVRLEEETFDLVHARSVLMHIPLRETAMDRLAGAIRPGGWILLEEPDAGADEPEPSSPEAARRLYRRVIDAVYEFVREQGVDPCFGRDLAEQLRIRGFEEIHREVRQHTFRGGTEPRSPHMPALRELRDPVVERGLVTATEYDDFLSLDEDARFSWRESAMISVRGRKPT